MAVSWVEAACNQVKMYRFRGSCCLFHQDNKTLVHFHQTVRRNTSEDSLEISGSFDMFERNFIL